MNAWERLKNLWKLAGHVETTVTPKGEEKIHLDVQPKAPVGMAKVVDMSADETLDRDFNQEQPA